MQKNWDCHAVSVGMQNGIATLGVLTKLKFFTKLSRLLPYDPVITLLDTSPNKLKIYPHKNLHINFIVALFIIAQTSEQSRCPSLVEWINKLWYIQTMEYYSVLKINELSSQEKTWRKLKCIFLSEKSRSDSNYMTF